MTPANEGKQYAGHTTRKDAYQENLDGKRDEIKQKTEDTRVFQCGQLILRKN